MSGRHRVAGEEGEEKVELERWTAPVSIPSNEMVAHVKETLEEMGFTYRRERTYHHYSRLLIVLPMPESSYVFRFRVLSPAKFLIDLYDTRPTHSGELHFIELRDVENLDVARRFLRKLVARMPRKPWKFTFMERFRTGFLTPEYVRARRIWWKMLREASEEHE